jgi:hypothetical protein
MLLFSTIFNSLAPLFNVTEKRGKYRTDGPRSLSPSATAPINLKHFRLMHLSIYIIIHLYYYNLYYYHLSIYICQPLPSFLIKMHGKKGIFLLKITERRGKNRTIESLCRSFPSFLVEMHGKKGIVLLNIINICIHQQTLTLLT